MCKNTTGQLIYRATRDGFKSKTFHEICDNVPNTIVIIKTDSNDVFGGFTSVGWNSRGVNGQDEDAFVFSLRRSGTTECHKMRVTSPDGAIYGGASYGPVFGDPRFDAKSIKNGIYPRGTNFDICIRDNSNIETGSHTNIGRCYQYPDGYCSTQNCKQFLASTYNNWLTVEIEVYELLIE